MATSPSAARTGATVGPQSWRFAAALGSLLLAVAWTLWGGKVFHWDAINYHFYLGFSALNDRFDRDFFAAGTPSYINPYAYIPLYLLDRSGVSVLVAATTLAALHGLMLWLTYEVALLACAPDRSRQQASFGMLALALAALSPVFLQGLGLTLVDIPIGVITLAGWLAMSRSVRGNDVRLVAVGGVLCGIAAALKLSNALYAAAALSMVVFLPGTWRQRLLAAAVYAGACGFGFVVVSAPWSLRLWEEYGNPLFPFLNHWFASPDFISTPLHAERFRPANWLEFLTRPLDMLSPLSRQHTEGHAPDLRYAAAFILLAAWGAASWWRGSPAISRQGEQSTDGVAADRVLVALAVAFVVAWCLWLLASGNSRYFMPMGCITAVLIAATLQRFHRKRKGATLVVAGLLVVAQITQIVIAADWKRDGGSWEGPLLRTEFPERFRKEPYLFLSTSFFSGSAFLPHWHPDSGMITTSGFYAIGPDKPGWQRARKMIDRNIERVRILRVLPKGVDEQSGLPGHPSDLDIDVRRFGLKIDAGDCEFLKVQSSLLDTPIPRHPKDQWTTFLTCRLVAAPELAEAYLREVAPIDAVFDRVEDTCPNLFHPSRPVTEQLPRWVRLYNMGSEIQLWIEGGRVLYFLPLIGGDAIDIGSVEAWRQGAQPIDCTKKSAPAFNGLLEQSGPE